MPSPRKMWERACMIRCVGGRKRENFSCIIYKVCLIFPCASTLLFASQSTEAFVGKCGKCKREMFFLLQLLGRYSHVKSFQVFYTAFSRAGLENEMQLELEQNKTLLIWILFTYVVRLCFAFLCHFRDLSFFRRVLTNVETMYCYIYYNLIE